MKNVQILIKSTPCI